MAIIQELGFKKDPWTTPERPVEDHDPKSTGPSYAVMPEQSTLKVKAPSSKKGYLQPGSCYHLMRVNILHLSEYCIFIYT